MIYYFHAYLLIFLAAFLQVDDCRADPIEPPEAHGVVHDTPWFTGPLLTPSARVIPKGHFNLEPYLFWNVTTGKYKNDWKAISTPAFNQLNTQLQIKIGIIDRLDITCTPQSFASYTRGRSGISFGDFPFGIDYQLYDGKPEDWLTYAKLSVIETFPTGKYQKLDPDRLNADVGGQGSFITNIGLTFSKMVKLPHHRFLELRWNFTTSISAPANVRGFSIYGGNRRTRGRVNPGTSFSFVAGTEYTIIREISLACDILAQYSPRAHFKGFTEVPVGALESIQFSLAPAIEYNWNSSMGIIVGTWFTFAGRNSNRFISGVAAFNYSY